VEVRSIKQKKAAYKYKSARISIKPRIKFVKLIKHTGINRSKYIIANIKFTGRFFSEQKKPYSQQP
jgi:hypothetical protein